MLDSDHSDFAKKLLFALKCRIIERRQTVHATLLAYLEDPSFLDNTADKEFVYSSHDEIAKAARELLIRIFPLAPPAVEVVEEELGQDDPDEPELVEVEPPSAKKRRSEEFKAIANKAIELKANLKQPRAEPKVVKSVSSSSLDDILKDMAQFEKYGERPSSLQKVILI